jgi:hypothetical protein
MNFSKLSVVIGVALAALCSGAAAAPLIDLGGYAGPIDIKFEDYESFTTSSIGVGSVNFGVIEITSIQNANTGANIWVQDQAGQYLSAVFNGITVSSVTPTATGFMTTATGGVFNIWLDSSNFDPGQGTTGYTAVAGCAVGGLCYNGITNSGGTDVLNLDLVPGTDTTNPTSTLDATTTSIDFPLSGHAEGYADITGGADASQFGTGGFVTALGTLADFHILDDFCTNGQSGCAGPTSSNWQLFSNDPVEAIAIPEPASLSLFAAALLGLGVWLRRRQ